MLCDYCQKNEATNLLKQTVNGTTKLLHICDSCANSMLYSNLFTDFSINQFFNQGAKPIHSKKICDKCSMSLEDIMNTGKVGCDRCYEVFSSELSRSIEKIHGKSNHIGKAPRSAAGKLKQKHELAAAKEKLSRLIEAQNFEEAALVRDEIKKLESELNGNIRKEVDDHE